MEANFALMFSNSCNRNPSVEASLCFPCINSVPVLPSNNCNDRFTTQKKMVALLPITRTGRNGRTILQPALPHCWSTHKNGGGAARVWQTGFGAAQCWPCLAVAMRLCVWGWGPVACGTHTPRRPSSGRLCRPRRQRDIYISGRRPECPSLVTRQLDGAEEAV